MALTEVTLGCKRSTNCCWQGRCSVRYIMSICWSFVSAFSWNPSHFPTLMSVNSFLPHDQTDFRSKTPSGYDGSSFGFCKNFSAMVEAQMSRWMSGAPQRTGQWLKVQQSKLGLKWKSESTASWFHCLRWLTAGKTYGVAAFFVPYRVLVFVELRPTSMVCWHCVPASRAAFKDTP